MNADLKKRMYALLDSISFGIQQRELIARSIERRDDAWAEAMLAAFAKAKTDAAKALKMAERYQQVRKKRKDGG